MPDRIRSDVKRRLGVGAALAAVLAYGWWFTDREPFSPGALRALLVAIVVLIAVAEVRRRRASIAPETATRRGPGFRGAVVVWSAVIGAVFAWELIALRSLPRTEHPTISYLVENVEQYHLARLALYAGWIWLGWTLAS